MMCRLCKIVLWIFAAVLSGCAAPVTVQPSDRIPIRVSKPDRDGPFPAVVIMHDCSGLGPRSSGAPNRWAKLLIERGYVVVIPDSFSTRGFPDGVCTDSSPNRVEVSPPMRVKDAYAALAHARALPYVNGERIGIMGGSHGGSTTLNAMVSPEERAGFAAAVALYPACGVRIGGWYGNGGVYRPAAPLLILIGEKDDWTPAAPCQRMSEAAQAAGHPVSIKVYLGAHHSFDSDRPERYVASRINPNAPNRRGATTDGNPQAWADSIREVEAFFARHLK
jgi:dienelactone hydrolase